MTIVKEFAAIILNNLFGLILSVLIFLYMDAKTDTLNTKISELKAALERCEKK